MRRKIIGWLVCISALLLMAAALRAQGTAFTYQGQLSNGSSPANGLYDFSFALYNSTNLSAQPLEGPLTNSAVPVTNGLFTTLLNFGPNVFTGPNFWLGIGVRTNGGNNAFTALSPAQPLTPTPYAIFANTASNLSGTLPSAQLSGTLPSAQIGGIYSNAVTFSNGTNSFNGVFSGTFSGNAFGAFSGNGSSLSNLNASQLTTGTVADARLSTNVALLNANQTFSGVNSFTNFGNSFRGSFFGNGLVGWVTVPGTTQPAARDTGYMLTSPSLTTVTLPLSSALTNSDIIRVSGAGAGGWLVAENSGQTVLGNFASYGNSDPLTLLTGNNFQSVAASADGVILYAVGSGFSGVLTSLNSGQTWTFNNGIAGSYSFVACSANGRVVYVGPSSGTVLVSTNAGATWASTAFSTSGNAIACTANGGTLIVGGNYYACSGNGTYRARLSGGVINLSTNSGSTWFNLAAAPAANLSCLAVSSDCTRLAAAVNNGLLYASANQGATWTSISPTNQIWSGLWMSPDGSKVAGAVSTAGSINGGVYSCAFGPQPNTVSTNGAIGGSQGTAVELQYTGNGMFMPVSSAGLIWAN